jgi:hypothetical protein
LISVYYINIHDVQFDWTTDDGIEPTFDEKNAIRDMVVGGLLDVPVVTDGIELSESIANAISDKTGWSVLDFEYNIYGVGEKEDENV